MSLDTSGVLLEGVRIAPSSNVYVYPPRNLVTPEGSAEYAATSHRAEYCIVVSGQDLSSSSKGLEIGDPSLRFLWTRNDSVFRFDYDSFAGRWSPAPGAPPSRLGTISNTSRLTAPIPDPSAYADSVYQLYLGLPRVATFSVTAVSDPAAFGSPPAGRVEVSLSDGQLNFSASDLANPQYAGGVVYASRQGFFDRTRNKGAIGSIAVSGPYDLFLNPIPASGQLPLVRCGSRPHMTSVQFASEASMPHPVSPGVVNFAFDTGRVRLQSPSQFPGETVYYDGVAQGSLSLNSFSVGTIVQESSPALIGNVGPLSDATRYVFFATGTPDPDHYFTAALSDAVPVSMPDRLVVVVRSTGAVYVSSGASAALAGRTLAAVDTYLRVDRGVTLQVFRSGANTPGVSSVPDFVEYYKVRDQVMVDGLQQSPYLMLPALPLQDSDLSYRVAAGSGGGGTFVGKLAVASDPSAQGNGYTLDPDNRRVGFTRRKTYTKVLGRPASSVKLDDGVITPGGFKATVNSVPAVPGSDFRFDPVAGVVDFLQPVGEDDVGDKYDLTGSVALPSSFTSPLSVFTSSDVGSYLFVKSGPNAGFRRISSVASPVSASVSGEFVAAGPAVADVRKTYETIADRLWGAVSPPMKKFSLYKSDSVGGIFTKVPESEFSVVPQIGQVNLSGLAEIGKVYKASYTSVDSTDDGATSVQTARTEVVAFKVRLDPATYVPGTNTAAFNSAGRTVLPAAGVTVIVDGVRVDPSLVHFTAPGSVTVGVKLTTQEVLVNYSVAESPGGSKTMTLSHVPVIADYPTFTSGSSSVSLNGGVPLASRSAVLVGGDVLVVRSSSYSATTDVTTVVFTTEVVNDFVGGFSACEPLSFQAVPGTPDPLPAGGNVLTLPGSVRIRTGTVVELDGDPYLVSSAAYLVDVNKTSVTLAVGAYRNYVSAAVLASSSPVLGSGSEFATSMPADPGSPLTLFKGGHSPRTLSPDSDYILSDGGAIHLTAAVGFGDSLLATYVARKSKRAGTVLGFNYSHVVAPDDVNGMAGQKLVSSYNTYAPDSFFYRVETAETYMPELVDAVRAPVVSQSPSGPAGPPGAMKNKDHGLPSLYFDEQKFWNLDFVTKDLLKYYSEVVNAYEDLLSCLDGRVVGGTSGKFRYDGNLNNPPRDSYPHVTNDVDDRVKIYSTVELTSFYEFTEVGVYVGMWETGPLSRMFPVSARANVFLGPNTAPVKNGQVIGNLGVASVASVSTMSTAPAVSSFTALVGLTSLQIEKNGDPSSLTPPFSAGQKLIVYADDGTQVGLTVISSVSGSGPFFLNVAPAVPVVRGGVVVDVDLADPANKAYFPGVDLNVDLATGNLVNSSVASLISSGAQRAVAPSSIVTCTVGFNYQSTSPRRVPALDGSTLDDSGLASIPPLRRACERDLLQDELMALSDATTFGYGVVQPDGFTVVVTADSPAVGHLDTLKFVGGVNDGAVRTVATVFSPTSFSVSAALTPSTTPVAIFNSSYTTFDYRSALSKLVGVISTNSASAPAPGAVIGGVDSEMKILTALCRDLGSTLESGTGAAAGAVLTDPSASFPASSVGSYLFVSSGPNVGLYKVASSTPTTVTVSGGFPASASAPYSVLSKYSFLTDAGPEFLAGALKKTSSFLASTLAWSSTVAQSGLAARVASITQRISDISDEISETSGVLVSGDSLYNGRYAWIQQRTDRVNGFLVRGAAASASRQAAADSLVQSQQKMLALSTIQGG